MKTTRLPASVARLGIVLAALLLGIAAEANGSAGVEPVTGPDLVLWLDAQDIDGDGDVGDNPSHGQLIGRWTDKSGCGNHATQDVLDRQPACNVRQHATRPERRSLQRRHEAVSVGRERGITEPRADDGVCGCPSPASRCQHVVVWQELLCLALDRLRYRRPAGYVESVATPWTGTRDGSGQRIFQVRQKYWRRTGDGGNRLQYKPAVWPLERGDSRGTDHYRPYSNQRPELADRCQPPGSRGM